MMRVRGGRGKSVASSSCLRRCVAIISLANGLPRSSSRLAKASIVSRETLPPPALWAKGSTAPSQPDRALVATSLTDEFAPPSTAPVPKDSVTRYPFNVSRETVIVKTALARLYRLPPCPIPVDDSGENSQSPLGSPVENFGENFESCQGSVSPRDSTAPPRWLRVP